MKFSESSSSGRLWLKTDRKTIQDTQNGWYGEVLQYNVSQLLQNKRYSEASHNTPQQNGEA